MTAKTQTLDWIANNKKVMVKFAPDTTYCACNDQRWNASRSPQHPVQKQWLTLLTTVIMILAAQYERMGRTRMRGQLMHILSPRSYVAARRDIVSGSVRSHVTRQCISSSCRVQHGFFQHGLFQHACAASRRPDSPCSCPDGAASFLSLSSLSFLSLSPRSSMSLRRVDEASSLP